MNLIFNTYLAFCETFRIRQTLIPTTVIVIGMALPAAIQMGFRDGLGKELEQAITKSPKASELQITATSKRAAITNRLIEQMQNDDPRIRFVIPDVTKVVQMSFPGSTVGTKPVSVTLLPTVSGDPLLEFYGSDVLPPGGHGVVLSSALAKQLNLRTALPGDTVEIELTREEDNGLQSYKATLPVHGIGDFADAPIAYVDWGLMDQLEGFHQGAALPVFGWPAMARGTATFFESYLAFSKTPFDQRDQMKLLAHGLKFEEVPQDHPERTLFGFLESHQLHSYRIFADGTDPTEGEGLLSLSAIMVERITDADDVAIPWSEPVHGDVNNSAAIVVGLSFRSRWLLDMFVDGVKPFAPEDIELSGLLLGNTQLQGSDFELTTGPDLRLQLNPINPGTGSIAPNPISRATAPLPTAIDPGKNSLASIPKADPNREQTLIVPAELLAHIKATSRGECEFDSSVSQFLKSKQPNQYFRARVIAQDIHSVPDLDDEFQRSGYAVISQKTQVRELRNHLTKLHLWSQVVIVTVGSLGFFTLIMTLLDNTARKRGQIALLMANGASRRLICYVFVLRALLISGIALLATTFVSLSAAEALSRYGVSCWISADTLIIVSGASVLSCLLGAFVSLVPLRNIDPASIATQAEGR